MEPSREELMREGQYLYLQIDGEYRRLSVMPNVLRQVEVKNFHLVVAEEVFIALALFARKQGIEEGINNCE